MEIVLEELRRNVGSDTSIMKYLALPRNIREVQHVIRRMRYSELIGNFVGSVK
jgi:hypothetical protein